MAHSKLFYRRWSIIIITAGLFIFAGAATQAEVGEHKIELSALWPGSSIYTNAVLWAKQINQSNAGVEAIAREGKGPNVDIKTLLIKPAKRAHLVFFGVEDSWWGAQQGFPGWKRFVDSYDINNLRHLCLIGFTTDVMLSINPKITSMHHMEGKSYVPASVDLNNAKAVALTEPFKIAGIKVKFEALGVKPMIESLRDGLIDVIHGGIALVGRGKHQPSGYLNEIFAVKKVYPVSYDLKYLQAMKEKTGHPGVIVKFQPKAITEHQDYEVYSMGKSLSWMCDVSVPDEVVTAILQTYYDNLDKFGEISVGGRILSKNTMAAMNVPESRLHPAAAKFYKKMGVPIVSMQDTGLLPR